MTLAEILAEGKRLNTAFQNACDFRSPVEATEAIAAKHAFYIEHGPRLARVAEKTLALFAALDYVDPGWREETCVTGGDEVNRAWVDLEKSLGQGPDAAVRGEEETNDQP